MATGSKTSVLSLESLDPLVSLGKEELDSLYSRSDKGPIPRGVSDGKALFFTGSALTSPMARIAVPFWQGKIFNEDGSLLNRVAGMRAVRAQVYDGESWFDGKPSVIIDYSGTSLLFGKIRDEIRQIAPGMYLGKAYFRGSKPVYVLDFALDFRAHQRQGS